MDVRLTAEQQQLRDAAAKLVADLGAGSVGDLDDAERVVRLEKTVSATGWRALRRDGASGVEVALVAEEFGRGLVDVPYLGPVLADELQLRINADAAPATIVNGETAAPDARGISRGIGVSGDSVFAVDLTEAGRGVDLTRFNATALGASERLGSVSADQHVSWHALALVATSADMLGAARGALDLATDYAKIRQQYGKTIGSYQAVAHMLAESLAMIAGSTSVLWYAAWAIDELSPSEALDAGRIAKLYCARAAKAVCETSIQVHGGIGNTWDCLAHVYLRRVLVSTGLWPVTLREINVGLS
ncbi:acyl-CoA dehydrogenase family protein [Mycobacterium paraintracellulare]|uniref:acyl-CoA dehydrogenase family protein n=1 Tax=Mycobacterium paraintracellulare TaxID=1138383 RepID=UPI0019274391|nr:acyl-CoA dehydrogenase family protein [Mycobacterium paraintracellulare]BCP14172.1 acyl-CoA dehydrogenase [Mycobacterium paraintracellulare]